MALPTNGALGCGGCCDPCASFLSAISAGTFKIVFSGVTICTDCVDTGGATFSGSLGTYVINASEFLGSNAFTYTAYNGGDCSGESGFEQYMLYPFIQIDCTAEGYINLTVKLVPSDFAFVIPLFSGSNFGSGALLSPVSNTYSACGSPFVAGYGGTATLSLT